MVGTAPGCNISLNKKVQTHRSVAQRSHGQYWFLNSDDGGILDMYYVTYIELNREVHSVQGHIAVDLMVSNILIAR